MFSSANLAAAPAGIGPLVWSDEFDGTTLNYDNWRIGAGLNGVTNYTIDALVVGNGVLTIKTYTENGAHYSGWIDTQDHTGNDGTIKNYMPTYGYFESRIQFNTSPGHWSAFWLNSPGMQNPTVGDPAATGTEVDIIEHRRSNGSGTNYSARIHMANHWDGYGSAHKQSSFTSSNLVGMGNGSWHTYGLLWEPDKYTYYFDGQPVWTHTTAVSNVPKFILLTSHIQDNSWAGDIPVGGYGSFASNTTNMMVDYVRVYALTAVPEPSSATIAAMGACFLGHTVRRRRRRPATHGSPCASRSGFTLVELLVVIAIIGVLVALLLPAVQAAREAARRSQCSNNFKQAGLALQNHHSAKNQFPQGMRFWGAGYPPGCSGWPAGSFQSFGWSTSILPFLEETAVYEQLDLTRNYWEHPRNWVPGGAEIKTYVCPSDPEAGGWIAIGGYPGNGPRPQDDFRMINMAGVAADKTLSATGPGVIGMWCSNGNFNYRSDANGVLHNLKAIRVKDISDGTSHTLIVGEITGAPGTVSGEGDAYFGHMWVSQNVQDTTQGINGPLTVPGGRNIVADPIDGDGSGNAHMELYREIGFSSWHPGGGHFALADGSVQFFSDNIDQTVLDALATRAGGEAITDQPY